MSDAGELQTLTAAGITSLSLASDHHARLLPDGSRIYGFLSFVQGGVTRQLADVAFAYNPKGFVRETVNSGSGFVTFRYRGEEMAQRPYL